MKVGTGQCRMALLKCGLPLGPGEWALYMEVARNASEHGQFQVHLAVSESPQLRFVMENRASLFSGLDSKGGVDYSAN